MHSHRVNSRGSFHFYLQLMFTAESCQHKRWLNTHLYYIASKYFPKRKHTIIYHTDIHFTFPSYTLRKWYLRRMYTFWRCCLLWLQSTFSDVVIFAVRSSLPPEGVDESSFWPCSHRHVCVINMLNQYKGQRQTNKQRFVIACLDTVFTCQQADADLFFYVKVVCLSCKIFDITCLEDQRFFYS